MKHFVIVAILVVISTILVYLFLTGAGLLPVEAAQQAVTIDRLFNIHFALISFLFSLIVVFIHGMAILHDIKYMIVTREKC